ncbi:hypothetical protein [Cellulomonas sp. KRMCY2]|uniref:hypothetical protein n=1 Tax=Cellulomonas sp. KRMCY2 TaxID=1304865 RepID=UPI00045EA1D6|nr:hypothetical protein [Cellulomonas sp. KRMCY2]
MNERARSIARAVVAVATVAILTSCSGGDDLTVQNDGDDAVTVEIGEETLDVPASSAVSLLDYGCSPGDVTVRFGSGEMTVLDGPICPPDTIMIRGGEATVRSATPSATP